MILVILVVPNLKMIYTKKLQAIIKKNKSNLVIGLDTDLQKIPAYLLKYKNPALEFNKIIINVTKDVVAGYKFNMAFYEFLQENGIEAMKANLKNIPDNMIKICDAKRGDIGNTSEMYACTYFDKYNFDSITASPYVGVDGIEPFLERKDKLVYVLALTSNSGCKDFQIQKSGKKKIYEIVIQKFLKLNKNKNIGFVFGANHLKELSQFTKSNPEIPLLIPGIGAQANDLNKLLKNLHSKSFVINSSRGIIYSASREWNEKGFITSVRKTTIDLNKEINLFTKEK